MTVLAVSFSGVVMEAISYSVSLVLRPGPPPKIDQSVVLGVVVLMKTLHPFGTGANKGLQDHSVKKDVSVWLIGVNHLELEPPIGSRLRVPQSRRVDPDSTVLVGNFSLQRLHPALVGDFIESLVPDNREPALLCIILCIHDTPYQCCGVPAGCSITQPGFISLHYPLPGSSMSLSSRVIRMAFCLVSSLFSRTSSLLTRSSSRIWTVLTRAVKA